MPVNHKENLNLVKSLQFLSARGLFTFMQLYRSSLLLSFSTTTKNVNKHSLSLTLDLLLLPWNIFVIVVLTVLWLLAERMSILCRRVLYVCSEMFFPCSAAVETETPATDKWMELLNSADYTDVSWASLSLQLFLVLHFSGWDKDNFVLSSLQSHSVPVISTKRKNFPASVKTSTSTNQKNVFFNLISNFSISSSSSSSSVSTKKLLCVYSMCIILINVQKKINQIKSRETAVFRKIYLDLFNLIFTFFSLLSFSTTEKRKKKIFPLQEIEEEK